MIFTLFEPNKAKLNGDRNTCSGGMTSVEWVVMMPRLVHAEYVRDFVIHIKFADGAEGDVDLQGELEGEVFEPLKNQACFKAFKIHPELHTVTWPNGADFAPEFLYEKVSVPA